MKNLRKTKGKIGFGGAIKKSTIEAVLSTRKNIDAPYPERMTFVIHNHGSILYTKFDMVGDKVRVLGRNPMDLGDINMIYVMEDDTEEILPLALSLCDFTVGYVPSDNDPIILNWDGDELVSVTNVVIK